jgi:hypothetical protein
MRVPDYGGRCLTTLLEAVVGLRSPQGAALGDLQAALSGSSAVVLVILDGLGALQLDDRRQVAPSLWAGQLEVMSSVAPSTTVTALTSLMTGVEPGRHGLVGYRFAMGHEVLQALRWTVDGVDASTRYPPETVQPVAPRLSLDGQPVPYVANELFAASCFTSAHLRGCLYLGVRGLEEMPGRVASATEGKRLTVAYHDGIDKTAHREGLGSAYERAIAESEAMVVALRRQLDEDVAIVVTSDHGQVDVGPAMVRLSTSALAQVDFMSGEGRFRWLHAFPGGARALYEQVAEEMADSCWVLSKRQVQDLGLLGELEDFASDRLGDVAVIPFTDHFVPDPVEDKELRMKSRHGSLTEAEMLVPLIVL